MSDTNYLEVLSRNIARKISKLAKDNCLGCYYDHPSQREHTCLGIDYHLREVDNVQLYFAEVFEEEKETIIKEVLECLNEPIESLREFYDSHRKEIYLKVKEFYD